VPGHLDTLRANPAGPSAGDLAGCTWRASLARGGVTWTLGVRDGVIAGSHVEGATDLLALASFAATQLVGLPVREAREHGAARTELALRGLGGEVPVKGVFLPRRAGTGFSDLQAILDEWASAYDAHHGAATGLNEYDVAPGAAWARMGADEQLLRARDVVARTAAELGLAPDAVQVIAIERDVVVQLTQPDVTGSGAKGRVLMAVERALRRELEPALVVTTEERRDGNKLRRLTVAKEA
jgi:hypothetical protein